MRILDCNPADGQAFQGDVAIVSMPTDIEVAAADEIEPVNGCLILQRGEATGHHHASDVSRPRVRHLWQAPQAERIGIGIHDAQFRHRFNGTPTSGSARLYRHGEAIAEFTRRGILTRVDLAISCHVVRAGPVIVYHAEHDGIRLAPGNYYVGRHAESGRAELRLVQTDDS